MVVMKLYSSLITIIIIKMVWLLVIITNHQLIMARDRPAGICIEEEKQCLLELKAWLGSSRMINDDDGIFKSNFLPSWVDHDRLDDDGGGGNCCDGWERVTCHPFTGHVLELHLNRIYGFIYDFNSTNWNSTGFEKLSALKQLENLDISWNDLDIASVLPSLSTTIKSLRVLDISGNYISSSQGFEFEKLAALKQLEKLYIKEMKLNRSFLSHLSKIKSLKVLDLEGNRLFVDHFSSKDCEALLGLRKLEELSLAYNNNNLGRSNEINMSCLGSIPSFRSLSLDGNYGINGRDTNFPILGLDAIQQLEVLSMVYCGITTKDVQSWSKMEKIRNLDLTFNELTKDVLVELSTFFPSLQFLNLSYNPGKGSLTNEGLCKMNKLQELDLSDNGFEGGIPTCLNELSFLRRLDLSNNQLSGNLSSIMFRDLNSLQYINLIGNSFQGTFSLSAFTNLSKLEEVLISNCVVIETEEVGDQWVPKFQLKTLEMSNCSLNKIPKFLFFQKDLSWLDLSLNRLGGSFPDWLLANNTRLEHLILRDNNFGGSLSLPQTKNDQIIALDISSNQLKGHIPANIGQLLPFLRLLNIKFNDFDGAIPRSLGNMSSLMSLVMSNNNLVGEVPIEIMTINSLNALDLSSNHLGGFSSTVNLSIEFMDISGNKMSGHIPLPTAHYITEVLVMRHNYFSGLFPCELYMAKFLDISYNSFTGALPDAACQGFDNRQMHLNLHGNKFTGLVPEIILNSSSLLTLDIGNNFFSGRIPNLIHDQSRLQVLSARGNGLSGAIPDELCKLKMLNLLDLSHNSFSGSIPTCLGTNLSFEKNEYIQSDSFQVSYSFDRLWLKFLYTPDVQISSKHRIDSYSGKILDLMYGLDLSSNNLNGEIPDSLGNLSSILALNLSHNWLSGPIPQSFSNLREIESLDLSHNNLSGEIPWNLANLNFLEVFSVAYNNLSGRLPERRGQFGTFEGNSYAGNPYLCGLPLKKECEHDGDNDEDDEHDEEKWYDIDKEGFFACFMAGYIVYIMGFITVLWINSGWRHRWFNFMENLLFAVYYFLSDTLYRCVS